MVDTPNDSGGWGAKLALGVAGIIVAILTTALTPLGSVLQEWLFPTKATVEGQVLVGTRPISNATVEVDSSLTSTTGDDGLFYIANVRRGVHELTIQDKSGKLFHTQFAIARQQDTKKLGTIAVDREPVAPNPPKPNDTPNSNSEYVPGSGGPVAPELALVYHADPVPPNERANQSNPYRLFVSLGGPASKIQAVSRVTYYLHPTFAPNVVTVSRPQDNFALTFSAWGQFELKAKVYFANGSVQDLTKYLAF